MNKAIRISAIPMILLGLAHTYVAFFCRYLDEDGLWFLGSGFAVLFAGIINLLAVDGGSSKFSLAMALTTNALMLTMFCYALPILENWQVYIGIAIFLVATVVVGMRLFKEYQLKVR